MTISNYIPLIDFSSSDSQVFDFGDLSKYTAISIQAEWQYIDNFDSTIQVVVRNDTNAQWLPVLDFNQLLTQTPGSVMFDFTKFFNKYVGLQVVKGMSTNGEINVYITGK